MKLYKFKSLQNFEYVADIFCKKRFHTALFTDLNDPMEGLFHYDSKIRQEYIDRIVKAKQKLRICSFSNSFDHLLLWAHYADGFNGICIEIEVAENPNFDLVEVDYSPFSVFVDKYNSAQDDLAKTILSGKNEVWDYEDEFRILTGSDFIDQGFSISAVYFGIRTSDVMKQTISSIVPQNVRLYDTDIGQENHIEKAKEWAKGFSITKRR